MNYEHIAACIIYGVLAAGIALGVAFGLRKRPDGPGVVEPWPRHATKVNECVRVVDGRLVNGDVVYLFEYQDGSIELVRVRS